MITSSQLLTSLQTNLTDSTLQGLQELDISNFANQTWPDDTFQEGKTLSTISKERSSLSYFLQSSKISAEKNELNVNLKGSDGGGLVLKVSSTKPLNDGYGINALSNQITWQYVGDKSSTADNVSFALVASANDKTTTAGNGITTFEAGSSFSGSYNRGSGAGNQLYVKGSDTYKKHGVIATCRLSPPISISRRYLNTV